MNSLIKTFSFPKNMNLSVLSNMYKLSSNEQKNLAILILARYKLSFFVKQNQNDVFVNNLYAWLEKNAMDFRDIEIAFNAYYNSKPGTIIHNEMFRIVKPLEEIAVYLSQIAKLNNSAKEQNIPENDTTLLKTFTLELLSYWYEELEMKTVYFNEIYSFDYIQELANIRKENALYGYSNNNNEMRKNLTYMYDYASLIADHISKYKFINSISSAAIKGRRKSKSRK